MKRLLFLLLALAAIAVAGDVMEKDRAAIGTATVDGDGADTARTDDTLKLGDAKAISSLTYQFSQTGPSHTKRGTGNEDSAWVRIKSHLADWWLTVDSFKVELPDTTVRYVPTVMGDTVIFGDLYAIVTIRDTASDSVMTISWPWQIKLYGKE